MCNSAAVSHPSHKQPALCLAQQQLKISAHQANGQLTLGTSIAMTLFLGAFALDIVARCLHHLNVRYLSLVL